jgi:hypothetical protein
LEDEKKSAPVLMKYLDWQRLTKNHVDADPVGFDLPGQSGVALSNRV